MKVQRFMGCYSMTLNEERRELDKQRRQLERERQEFSRKVAIEDRRLEQQKRLFDMKVKILEEELVKLASEKEHIERQKAFYDRVSQYENESESTYSATTDNVVRGEMFFSGVASKQSIKKRYKDLIKIYHPDNLDGDNETVQEINSEYSKLCAMYNIQGNILKVCYPFLASVGTWKIEKYMLKCFVGRVIKWIEII